MNKFIVSISCLIILGIVEKNVFILNDINLNLKLGFISSNVNCLQCYYGTIYGGSSTGSNYTTNVTCSAGQNYCEVI
jgi:hypothetical protein